MTRPRNVDVPRYTLLHEHFVRLCLSRSVGGDEALWATDRYLVTAPDVQIVGCGGLKAQMLDHLDRLEKGLEKADLA